MYLITVFWDGAPACCASLLAACRASTFLPVDFIGLDAYAAVRNTAVQGHGILNLILSDLVKT